MLFLLNFSDPTPSLGLPEAEYVELYNRSVNSFDLDNWTLQDANTVAIFPSDVLMTSFYVVITSTAACSLFDSHIPCIGLANFPTLNNDGDVLVLNDAFRNQLDSINYTLSWYSDEDKQQGGWSVELIDRNNICAEEENSLASENEQGGTPMSQNSDDDNKPDTKGPQLMGLLPLSQNSLLLTLLRKAK